MAGIRSISIFQRSPAWPTNQLGLPKGAYPRPCTSQLSRSPKPMPESPASTDPSLESGNIINVSLPRAADRKYSARTLEELVESIQTVLRRASDPASTLNLIDTVQRLGISSKKKSMNSLTGLVIGMLVKISLPLLFVSGC
ncbi:hypothetical protein OIU84_017099 [Salix udensis]|uniref:Uncharacterized protein n=1 Tax=Salix udensis TaxID=889485 RepID=A0AAD6L171_9ROSI|nr:hypothetical protein OIU84_017099 [Salix udensis]